MVRIRTWLTMVVMGFACTGDRATGPATGDAIPVDLHLDSRAVGPGGRIAVWIEADVLRIGAVQGVISYRPERLAFVGHLPNEHMAMVNATPGAISVAALARGGAGSRFVVLVFDVLQHRYVEDLRLQLHAVADTLGRRIPVRGPAPTVIDTWTIAWSPWYRDDLMRWNPPESQGEGPGIPPVREWFDGLRYGDVLPDGEITLADALHVMRVAIGLAPGDDPVLRRVANVHPANLPGFGEADDAIAPGWEPGGGGEGVLDVLDVMAIADRMPRALPGVVGHTVPGK